MDAGPLSAAARYASLGRSAVALEAQELRAALKAVAAQPDLAQLTGQASPLGRTSIQRALAAHFAGMGLDVPPERICVAHGGQAALRLAALAIAQRGQRVAADAITYPGWKLVASQLGLDLEPIAFDGDGPCRTSWSGYCAAGGSRRCTACPWRICPWAGSCRRSAAAPSPSWPASMISR